jgi:iron complex transport system substrate-binding protein
VGSDETNKSINSPEDFAQWMQDDMYVYAQAIGGEGNIEKAQKWCDYAKKTFDSITSVTSKLNGDQIPKVYYVRGPQVTTTHAGESITIWYVTMAGGHLVTSELDTKIAEVDAEQINAWNPDFIFMGRLKKTDDIVKSPVFQEVKAVKDGKVFVNPCGVYEWDYGTEGVLFVQWLAKTLHPDLFPDLDINAEIKWYYKEFYNYDLSDEELKLILNNQNPES